VKPTVIVRSCWIFIYIFRIRCTEPLTQNKPDVHRNMNAVSSKPTRDIFQSNVILPGMKNHYCPICNKAFALDVYLKSHLKTHRKQDGYIQCPKCPRRFASEETLQVMQQLMFLACNRYDGSTLVISSMHFNTKWIHMQWVAEERNACGCLFLC
jgi:hypothetical protein